MRNTLVLAAPSAEPPVDDLEMWARLFALSPAVTDQDRHERRVVLHLLAELDASR